ncbi:MAG: hypothetical protein AB1458_05795 [Bacteroidota bacterium]
MKKLAFLLGIASVVLFSACEKEEIQPCIPAQAAAQDITVEYRVNNTSSDVQVELLVPNQGGTGLESKTLQVNRTDYSFQFAWKSNSLLSVKAWNSNPSWKDITVEIYVNGDLFQSGTLDHTTAVASASGTFVE